ncbi:flagellar hook-length control protein FliK [Nitratireductor sp. GISD-1A_MAKvit]|uniref:flagellar hook-length control protein FliK n=1 Tax=Nitratireductor sp. GISD-1A_MAKvit TaxID=3234198 RepID=UPI0034679BB4
MNPAIGRGMPATANPLESNSRKQADSPTDAAGFQEALRGDENNPHEQTNAEKTREPGSYLFRWTLPQRLNAQSELHEVGSEELPSASAEARPDLKIEEEAIAPVEGAELLDPAAANTPASDGDADSLAPISGRAATLQPNSTAGDAVPTGDEASVSPRHENAQSPHSTIPPAADRQTGARVASDRPVLQQPAPQGKEQGVAGERPPQSGTDSKATQPVRSTGAEAVQRIGTDGLLRENSQQQQQAQPQQQPEIRVISIQRAPTPSPASEQPLATPRMTSGEASALNIPQQGEAGRMVQTLKIQLHPAELGMVTARLRIVADQLTVDLQVENAEARHRLGSDSDSIVKALRSLGYDIDRVTVQQSSHGAQSNTASGGNSRDGGFQSLHEGQSEGSRSHDRGNEKSSREQSGRNGKAAQESGDVAQSGIYI